MIKANELRIGNWIEEEVLGWVKVGCIGMDTTIVLFNHLTSDHVVKVHNRIFQNADFKPIPLTPEILMKCGFEKAIENAGNLPCFKKGKFTIAKWANERWQCWIGTIDLYKSPQYLHQLQNLYFALTGEELNIQL